MAVTIGASAGLIPAHAGKTPVGRAVPSVAWAHPRSRGENPMPSIHASASRGSSPLTRGKLVPRAGIPGVSGLIPAHAGKTPCPASSHSSRRAHPRSRGENIQVTANMLHPSGSSPLTRGKRKGRRHSGPPGRLIPAHAGKTTTSMAQRRQPRAHPRSRGENAVDLPRGSAIAGSSPLTRGKLEESTGDLFASGLIPAHAGKTTLRRGRHWRHPAHPRSRGENPRS